MKKQFVINGLAVTVSETFKGLKPAPWQENRTETKYIRAWKVLPYDLKSGHGYTQKLKADTIGKSPALYRMNAGRIEKLTSTPKQVPIPLQDNGQYTIHLSTEHGKTSFAFWSSIAKPVIDSDSDLLDAIDCFCSDACSGSESFDSFCDELGYDNDSIKARKVWRACVKSKGKLESILGDMDIYDFSNALRDLQEAV